jgi:hypothetical protein
MTTSERLTTALCTAVRSAWASDFERCGIAMRHAEACGEDIARSLAAAVGGPVWNAGLESLAPAYRPPDLRRILGLGHELTRYLIAPAPLRNASEIRVVARLGALANLIVSVHDFLADDRPGADAWLVPDRLCGLLEADEQPDVGLSPAQALTSALIRTYGRQVAALAAAAASPADELLDTILRMRDVHQRATSGVPASVLIEKNTLPFVIAAMPAWIIAASRSRRDDHLVWVQDVGAALGLLDDAVDLDDDLRRGHPNLVDLLGRAGSLSELVFADELVARLDELERRRRQFMGDVTAPAEHADLALRMVVMSWLGGHGFLAQGEGSASAPEGEPEWCSGQAS